MHLPPMGEKLHQNKRHRIRYHHPCQRTLLFDHKNRAWVKREANKEFDVSMGAYDGAEVCELVGPIRIVSTQKQNQHIQY